jgi:TRAP-type mannitol/chloroaromatic compound transport system substrate-binding protein
VGSIGVPSSAWFRRPVGSVEDLMNIAMRADGLSGELWRRLGANISTMPENGVVEAMRDGSLDAAELSGPWGDYDTGLASVVRNYYLPGFRAVGPSLELITNREAYDALPDDLKAVVRAAASASAMETYADFTYNNITSLPLIQDAGVITRELPNAIVRAAGRESAALLSELAAQSPMAAEVYESFNAFRKKAVAYTAAGDAVALRLRQVGLGA